MLPANSIDRVIRSASILLLLICAALIPVRAQTIDTTGLDRADSARREWLRPYAGAYLGGFPLMLQVGLRFGVDLYKGIAFVGVDAGYAVAGQSDWIPDITLRAQILSPVRIFGDSGTTYLHGFLSRFGNGRGYGGGIGYRRVILSNIYCFGELEIAVIRGDVEGNESDRVFWVPSLGRVGVYYEL